MAAPIDIISIPSVLQNPEFRFIRIRRRGKRPSHEFKQEFFRFPYNNRTLKYHINNGGNYAVLPGYGNLCIFDADEPEKLRELGLLELFEGHTYTVQTGSSDKEKYHFYFFCPDAEECGITGKLILNVIENGEPVHLGEIYFSGNLYCIGPDSIHPSGRRYSPIDNNHEIETICGHDFLHAFESYFNTQPNANGGATQGGVVINRTGKALKRKKQQIIEYDHDTFCQKYGITVYDVDCLPDPNYLIVESDDGELQGTHPIHGSTGGMNFSVNVKKNLWTCFRHDSGGDPIMWVAVAEGLIDCSEAITCDPDGNKISPITGEIFEQCVEIMRSFYGLYDKIPTTWREDLYDDEPQYEWDVDETQPIGNSTKTLLESLPSAIGPEHVTVIQSFPRIGKTHWLIEQLADARTGVYCTHTHSVIGHALNIYKRVKRPEQTAVWLGGKAQMCNKMGKEFCDCENCSKRPIMYKKPEDVGISLGEVKAVGVELLKDKKILTKLDVPKVYCPYFMLHAIESEADVCFTVPQFLVSRDPDMQIAGRELTVIDEDTTVSNFYPNCFEIGSYSYVGRHSKSIVSNISQIADLCRKIQDKTIGAKKRMLAHDKTILGLFKTIHEIDKELSDFTSGAYTVYLKDGRKQLPYTEKRLMAKLAVIEKKHFSFLIESGLDATDDTGVKAYKDYVLKKLAEYESTYYTTSDVSLVDIATTLLNPGEKLLDVSGKSRRSIFLIGGHTLLYDMNFDKLVIVGATEAELLAADLEKEGKSVRIINIAKFKYADNFICMKLASKSRRRQGEMMESMLHMLNRMNRESTLKTPCLVFAATKKRQEQLHTMLGAGAAVATNHNLNEIRVNHFGGHINIAYPNGLISRGQDVPFYDTVFLDSCNFATPYWTSRIHWAFQNRDTDDAVFAKIITKRILIDEITNCALRISPVAGDEDTPNKEDQLKVIIVKDSDFPLIDPNATQDMKVMTITNDNEMSVALQIISTITNNVTPIISMKRPELQIHSGKTKYETEGLFSKTEQKLEKQRLIQNINPRVAESILKHPGLTNGGKRSVKTLVKWAYDRHESRYPQGQIRDTIFGLLKYNALALEYSSNVLKGSAAAPKNWEVAEDDPELSTWDSRDFDAKRMISIGALSEKYLEECNE